MTTIRRRLLLLLLPALAILMLAGGIVDYRIAVATTQDAYDQALASAASAAAAFLHNDNGHLRFELSPAAVTVLRINRTDAGGSALFAVVDSSGALLAGSPGLPRAPFVTPTAHAAFEDARFQGQDLRLASVRVATAAGNAVITIAETRERRDRSQRVMLFGKLLVDFAELDVTLLLIWFAVHFGLQPLAALREQVEAQAATNPSPFDESTIPGELRPVVVAFNRVLALLRDAAQAQRRFVADAAHQMRTPIAGVLAQIELLVQDPKTSGASIQLASVERGIQSLAHTANQLLALARAEPFAVLQHEHRPVALQGLVHDLVERNLGRADKAAIDFGADVTAVEVLGDAGLLEDLLGNLIDNALKYTPSGGRVTVRCGAESGQPFLEVEDDGPGIPEADRRRVRERFYRRPGSPGVGCGLGLAIVDEIADVHDADLTIGAGAGGRGARMHVRFPPMSTDAIM